MRPARSSVWLAVRPPANQLEVRGGTVRRWCPGLAAVMHGATGAGVCRGLYACSRCNPQHDLKRRGSQGPGATWPLPSQTRVSCGTWMFSVSGLETIYMCCCCHGLCCPVPARPCSFPGPYVPLAHEAEVFGSCCSAPSWGVVCGVHSPSPGRVCVGTLFPVCLVLRPCVVAPPLHCVRFCPRTLACA